MGASRPRSRPIISADIDLREWIRPHDGVVWGKPVRNHVR